MKKIMTFLLLMLPVITIAQQVVIVDVSTLSEEGSNERKGVVLQKNADNEAFYNLIVELKNHSDKMSASKVIKSRKSSKSETEILDESIAKMEELKKKGIISEAEFQRMKTTISTQLNKNADYAKILEQQAAGKGSSNPSALKEKIRSYCIEGRFFYSASNAVDGMVRVEARTSDGKRRMGYIDATIGRVVIEPNHYSNFNNGTTKGFTKDGYITGHSGTGADMLDRSGRVVLTGYKNLYFYDDCRILKAVNFEKKVGIIDYQGNVLEPFIHDNTKSESLQKAANRIFKEKGGVKVEIW